MNFDKLWKAFPDKDTSPSKVYRDIGGYVYKNHLNDHKDGSLDFQNSCALRLSKALNYSDKKIQFEKDKTGSGGDGKWYYYKVKDLAKFLKKNFGPPTVRGGAKDKEKFLGKKGIIRFDIEGWDDAKGHLDLWNGQKCANKCY